MKRSIYLLISALLAFFVLFVLQSDFVLFGPIVAMVVWFPGYIGGHIIYTLDRIEYNTRCMAEKMNTDEK